MDEMMVSGSVTVTQSVGNRQSVGEGSPQQADVTKEKLPAKIIQEPKKRGRPKGSKNDSAKAEVHTRAPEAWSKVRLGYGVTKSIGDFEFVRIDVSAEDYCPPRLKQQTWDELDVVVSERIKKCLSEFEQFRSSKHIRPVNEVILEPIDNTEEQKPIAQDTKKMINKLLLNAAKFGKIGYAAAVEKMKAVTNEDVGQQIIKQLENTDYTYFKEIDDGAEGIIESIEE
jgi:hypothetical protein